MPTVSQLRHRTSNTNVSNTTELKPEAFKLWLPSELQPTTPCDHRLAAHEWELRHAQALDALNDVRSHLRLRSHIYIYIRTGTSGVKLLLPVHRPSSAVWS
jgi:hypothetical protein